MSSLTDFTTLSKPLKGIVLDYLDLFPTTELISHHLGLPSIFPEIPRYPRVGFIWSAVTGAFHYAQSLGQILKLEEEMEERLKKFANTTFEVHSNCGREGAPIIKRYILLTEAVAFEASELNGEVAGIFAVFQRLNLISYGPSHQLPMRYTGKVMVSYDCVYRKLTVDLEQSQVHCTEEQPISMVKI